MRKLFVLIVTVLLSDMCAFAQSGKHLFKGKTDVVSFTYRKLFEKDVPSTLDLIKSLGVTDIEFSNLFGKTAAELRAALDERHMTCSSFGVSYPDLTTKTEEVGNNAKTLGAKYVRVAWIPHKDSLSEKDAAAAAEEFNRVGKILKEKFGLMFVYHNHGYEFRKWHGATLYDLIVMQTDPAYVNFELDILWAFFPGEDPAKLVQKYGNRYKLMHLKDLRKGVKGDFSGGTSQENDVALGTGQIDIPAVIKAAQKAGVEHFYIEDESSNIATQVPQSIAYLKSLKE